MSVTLRQDLFAMDQLMEEGELDVAMGVASETKQTAKRKAEKEYFGKRKSSSSPGLLERRRRILALVDADARYLHRLSSYLQEHLNVSFDICEFTSPEQLLVFRMQAEPLIVVISGELYPALCGTEQEVFSDVIVLEDPNAQEAVSYEEEHGTGKVTRLNKFSSSERVVNAILDHCLSCSEVIRVGDKAPQGGLQILGVYSPLTRCLQSSFAATLGKYLSKRSKVLYLTLEPYPSLKDVRELEAEHDITDFMYYFECYPAKTPLYIEKVKVNLAGMDTIPPAKNFLTLRDISGETWQKVFEWIARTTEYAYVILDLHENLTAFPELLSMCDRLFTICGKEAPAAHRLGLYREMLFASGLEEVWYRTIRFRLPHFSNLPTDINGLQHSYFAKHVIKAYKQSTYRVPVKPAFQEVIA